MTAALKRFAMGGQGSTPPGERPYRAAPVSAPVEVPALVVRVVAGHRAKDPVPEREAHVEVPALHEARIVVLRVPLREEADDAAPADERVVRRVVAEVEHL